PTDILKLLPPPIVLSGSSLTAIERQLSRRRERLERAMNARIRRDFVPQSRNLRIPSVVRLEGLAKQVTMLLTRRKCLKRRELQIYLDTVHRLRDAIVVAIRKIGNPNSAITNSGIWRGSARYSWMLHPTCWKGLSSRGEIRPEGTCTPLR